MHFHVYMYVCVYLQAFYSVSLLDGFLVMFINGGKGLRDVKTSRRYNDGRVHSVALIKTKRL